MLCEHLFVMFADALLLLFEMADRDDERFHATTSSASTSTATQPRGWMEPSL
jgi:hypothetical protein